MKELNKRFHSCYPWHTGGDYRYLMNESDHYVLKDVLEFNTFDLYSKADIDFVLTPEIEKYYEDLLIEYFPEPLNWWGIKIE